MVIISCFKGSAGWRPCSTKFALPFQTAGYSSILPSLCCCVDHLRLKYLSFFHQVKELQEWGDYSTNFSFRQGQGIPGRVFGSNQTEFHVSCIHRRHLRCEGLVWWRRDSYFVYHRRYPSLTDEQGRGQRSLEYNCCMVSVAWCGHRAIMIISCSRPTFPLFEHACDKLGGKLR